MRTHRTSICWVALPIATALAAAAGCNSLIGSTGYYELPPLSSADASADGGALPDACVAGANRRTFEAACTSSRCVPYAGVLPTCDGGLCPLPLPIAAVEAGTTAASGTTGALDGGSGGEPGGEEIDAGSDAPAEGGVAMACSQVNADPNAIVYVTGSTALAAFIGEVSSALAAKVTIVYQQSGSCVGVRSALDPSDNVLSTSNGVATYFTLAGAQEACTLNASEGVVADVGASDVFYSTCYLGGSAPALPASVAENFGPAQVMNFAVPQSSDQQSISLNAAYYIFGFGGGARPVPPWTDPSQLQIRNANSGTQSLIAAAIGVPPDQWRGINHSTSAAVGAALVAAGQSPDPTVVNSALGILASDYLIQNSQTLRGLAVEDKNTACGYYPDSTAFARDNANTRDGHYPLWGPSHFYARVDPSTNLPPKPGVSQFINGLNGLSPLPGLDLVAEYASKGLVPECAMHVTRANDGGDYTSFKAPVTCNCYFDLNATGETSCQPCMANSDCPNTAPNCNKFGPAPQQGYCDL